MIISWYSGWVWLREREIERGRERVVYKWRMR